MLPSVLLDPFGGAEEADDGLLTLGTPICGPLCGFTTGVPADGKVLAEQRAASTDDDTR
jgi:hypothetical protein